MDMSKNNICKFNIDPFGDIICHRFVLETTERQRMPQRAEHNVLGIILNGSGVLTACGRKIAFSSGNAYYVAKGDTFSLEFNGRPEYIYIGFDGRRSAELSERLGSVSGSFTVECIDKIVDTWNYCLLKAQDGNLNLLASSALFFALAHFDPKPKERGDLISKILSYIDEHFTDTDFSLASVANEFGYDPKYISFVFKRKKGISFTEYLRDLRIEYALFLFRQGVVSVKNVAFLTGFKDSLYFSRIFTKQLGMSPSEYIKRQADSN